MIHDNIFIRDIIWKGVVQANKYIKSPLLILNAIIAVILVFTVCSIIDILEQKIIQTQMIKIFNKLNEKIKTRKDKLK